MTRSNSVTKPGLLPRRSVSPLSPNQGILIGTPVTISADVGPATQPPTGEPAYPDPTGTVQLQIDGASVGTPLQLAPSSSSGSPSQSSATVSIPTADLAPGTHTASLTYSGDSNCLANASAQVQFSVGTDNFSIAASNDALYVTSGQTTQRDAIFVNNSGGAFSGTVSFSCSGLPSGAVCAFNPATVTNNGFTLLTISTTQTQNASVAAPSKIASRDANRPYVSECMASAIVLVLLVPRRRRNGILLLIAFFGISTVGLTSCGGGTGSSSQPTEYATTTTLTAATSTPAVEASDTFTANVVAVGSDLAPSGSVQFSVDGAASGAAIPLSTGTAQFTTSFSTSGAHTVAAAYSGGSTFESSSSSRLTVTVPAFTGTPPGTYNITITGTSGTLSQTTSVTLGVQ